MSLEISISIALQATIMEQNDNFNDASGIGLFYVFCVAYGAFLIFVLGFYFCSSDPVERMERL
jgi:hypothetical protein